MEFLLQWVDEFDDAMSVLRHCAPRVFKLLGVLLLFVVTSVGLLLSPPLALAAVAMSAALAEVQRRRRQRT